MQVQCIQQRRGHDVGETLEQDRLARMGLGVVIERGLLELF
jgi:hypothetical protein